MSKTNKVRDLSIIVTIYLFAYVIGYVSCAWCDNIMLKHFVFDVVATVITFIFSVVLTNSSVYDAYWSVAPMVMSIWLFVVQGAFGVWQILFLIVFNLWSLRLTVNWITVFTDFGYEDWRYRKFRDETPKLLWPIVNFWGIHMMPTLVVFAGMLPIYVIAERGIGAWSIPGMLVILFGISMEFFADRQMHAFLADTSKTEQISICKRGLWKYSRHPNYLGEISVWLGVFLVMIPYATDYWYYGGGFLAVAILFNAVSIPLMEKRQLARRPEYAEYRKTTSRLLLWK